MMNTRFWREPVAAANILIGTVAVFVAVWAWLVCEANHCGPALNWLLLAGLLGAVSGVVISFEGRWASRLAAVLQCLALVPAGLFVAGVVSSASLGLALIASACWMALLAEASVLGLGE